MSDLQMSLTEWPYSSRKTKQNHLSWSPTGFLAAATGNVITILYPKKTKVEQILSFNPFNSPTTSVSWSCGPDLSGQTPLYLFSSAESQFNGIFDVSQFKTIASFKSSDSVVLSSTWSPISCDIFYIGDSKGKFSCYSITDSLLKLQWSLDTNFAIDFLSFSPFSPQLIVLASRNGTFQVVDTMAEKFYGQIGQFPVEDKEVNDCRFYPFLNDTLIFVIPSGVFIYPLNDDVLVKIIEAEAQHEPILNIAFDGSDETVFVILHSQYAREYVVKDTGFVKGGHTNYLSPRNKISGQFLAQAMYKNKLAILTKGQFIQFYECKKHRFVSTLVYMSISEKPLDYDVFSQSVVFGMKNGHISVSENSNIIKSFILFEGRVVKVAWLDDTTFIALGRIGEHTQKAFLVDLSLMKVTSLLKHSLEILDPTPIEICMSVNRIYFALTIGRSLTLIFNGVHNFASIFEDIPGCVTFSDNKDDELWFVSSKWVGKKYLLSQTTKERYSVIRMTTFNPNIFGRPKSKPIKAVALHGVLLAATISGDILVIDWYGIPSKCLQLRFKQIVSIEVNYGRCAVRDYRHNLAIIDFTNHEFVVTKIYENSAKQIKWLSRSQVLIQVPKQQSLTVLNINDLTPVFVNMLLPIYSTSDFLKRVSPKVTIEESVEAANSYGFGLLASLLQSLLPIPFSPFCLCANFNVDRIRNFLYVINGMLARSRHDLLRIKKARLEMLLNNTENAKNLLLSSPKNSSRFSIDVMKAGLFGCEDDNHTIPTVVSSLVNAGKENDAVDILIFTGHFKAAAKVLISMGDAESVLEIVATRLSDDPEGSEKIIDLLIQTLRSKKHLVHAAAILIAYHRFGDAASALREANLECVGAIVEGIVLDGSNISFVLSE